MDRQAQEYAAAMAFAQQQQQQQYGYHPQGQQLPQQLHGPPFMPPHPSFQQFPYHRPLVQQQVYPHHHPMLHLQQQQQPPPPFLPNLPSHHGPPPSFMHPFDPAPPPAAPPQDPELHKRIDKLVEYAAKNGPEFEAMIREKQQDNPDYSFLFGGEGHNYYRYKLWLSTRPPGSSFNPSFPSSVPMIPSLHNPGLSSSPLNHPPMGSPASIMSGHQLQQLPPFYDHQQPAHPQGFMGRSPADYDVSAKLFKGLSGPLPSDVAAELNNVLSSLTGTKESIKGAKMWFMQRSPFAPALAEALRDRIFALDDSERQLHIIFLANDILFDSQQRRPNPHELDNEALAFKPVLGSMLARIYSNPQNKEANQQRLDKLLQFWASKEIYDQETIHRLENEMSSRVPLYAAIQNEASAASDLSKLTVAQHTSQQWLHEKQPNEQEYEKQILPASGPSLQFPVPNQPFMANQLHGAAYPPVNQGAFPGSVPVQSGVHTGPQPTIPQAIPSKPDQNPPPYPLFPPGLIPGMVRKMQIGSGVPYSPLSPLDIPTVIPPSTIPETEILDRVAKFFKEIGEVNPSEGPTKSSEPDDYDGYEREPPIRKGGACIPPPPNLQQVDPETGMYADGSVDRKPGSSGSGHLGLGATANPNEISQYDDVYTSYRKQRSTNYHSSMSARAGTR